MCPECCAVAGGVDVGRALPPGMGGPLRPNGRVPGRTPIDSERFITMTDSNEPHDLVVERTFDAPVEQIWLMWTEPEHFKRWYGPTGATIPVAEMDARK